MPPPLAPPKVRRTIAKNKYVKTIVLFEGKGPDRKETRIPLTTDAARVLRAITAEKIRQKLEEALEDGREYTAKEYKDFAEALACLGDIDKEPAAGKGGSLTISNSVIASGKSTDDVASLLGAVKAANVRRPEQAAQEQAVDVKSEPAP